MDFLAHARAQRTVYELVAAHFGERFESTAYDERLKVLPVAADLDPFAGEAGLDGGLYGFGCRHVGFKIRGRAITYESKEKARDNSLSSADLKGNMLLKNGRFKIRILLCPPSALSCCILACD